MSAFLIGRRGAATSDEIREFLGLAKKEKLPAAGMPQVLIQGIVVYVLPLAPKEPRRRRRMAHRVRALCPLCFKDVSAGRLAQHARQHR